MKKTGYILLLVVCLMQSGGLLFIYNMRQCYVEYRMKQKLKGDNVPLETLVLSMEQYRQSKIDADEIIIGKKVYDVKSATMNGNNIELVAVNDKEEESILEEIKEMVSNTQNQTGQTPSQLHQLLTLVYLSPVFDFQFLSSDKEKSTFQYYSQKAFSRETNVLSPPPDVA